MLSLIRPRAMYLLAAIILLIFIPGQLSAQAIADQKNIFPTFYHQNVIRIHPDELQFSVSADYTFYKPDNAAIRHFKNNLHTAINRQDSLLTWGTTNIPSPVNMYLLRGTEQGVMSVTKDSPVDSLQANNTTVYEHISKNDPSNIQPVKTISLTDSSQFTTANAKAYILEQAAQQKALFFNESHVDPGTRPFLIGLLPELKKLGYTKLAMEAIMTDTITVPTTKIGFYTSDPAYGNLLRTALQAGFKLINYEDTSASAVWNFRDSSQAANMIHKLNAIADTGKLVVLAGHGHIHKHADYPDCIPMAMYFTRMSGIDPYSIDSDDANQVRYTGIDNTQPYILLRNNIPVNPNPIRYNLQVHYPETITDKRLLPVDLKTYHISPPVNSLLLIYDADEYEKAGSIDKLVPVYSFYPANTYQHLSLDTKKYIVYLFDNKGKLLSHQKIAIKQVKAAPVEPASTIQFLQP
jgi:hypothetical protein